MDLAAKNRLPRACSHYGLGHLRMARLRKQYGRGPWRKGRGNGRVHLASGEIILEGTGPPSAAGDQQP